MEKKLAIIDGNNAFISIAQSLWANPQSKFAVTNPVSVTKFVLGYVSTIYKRSSGVIIAFDDGTWRKDVFPYYKARRAQSKEKSDFPYAEFIECLNASIECIKNTCQNVTVIQIPGVEGDDIIGCLAPVLAPVCIYSSDQDLLQLQENFPSTGIDQYSPLNHEHITIAAKKYDLVDHIIRGDDTDDIPNILSPDTSFVEKIRQTPMIKSRYEPLYEKLKDPGFDGDSLDGELGARYRRNRGVIDLRYIPDRIVEKIFQAYERACETPRVKTLFEALAEKGILQ